MEPPVSRYPASSDGQSRKYPFGRQSALAALNVRLIVDSKPMAEKPKKKTAKPKREVPGVMGSLSAQRPARIATGRPAARPAPPAAKPETESAEPKAAAGKTAAAKPKAATAKPMSPAKKPRAKAAPAPKTTATTAASAAAAGSATPAPKAA